MSTPTPRSYEQILSQALSTYMSKVGVNDVNTGSAITSFFEAVAQAIYLATASNFSILRDYNLDRASGEALKRIAEEDRVRPLPARVATGRVTIKDLSFDKLSTKIYAGAPAPNAGSTTLKVSDTTGWPASGSIYVGRGTNNIEGPLAYSSIVPIGGFFEIQLSNPTTKFHNISETVILAQGGNRFVGAGTAAVAPSSGGAEDVNFTLTQSVVLLDGENEIKNVPVAAQNPGSQGNVTRNGIKRFISSPFTGANITNEIQFTTGRDEESDAEIRIRVKRARLSKGLGTATAVRNSVIGQQAPDEAATVVSAEIFSLADETILYIDNGEGYEEKTQGVGLEFIVDNALGGETNFQLATGGQQTSIAKAFLESNATSPFDIRGGDRLAISVGGVVTEHVFLDTDFRSPGAATSYEVVSSVNANPNLNFSGRTSDSAKRVTFFAKTEEREFIEQAVPTQGRNVGVNIGLSSNEVETLRLYRNRQLLSKNGREAIIETQPQQLWAANIATGDTLTISVDGTQFVTYVFTDADFINEGSFVTVNKNNTLQSWANVINSKITGITATPAGNRLQIVSNLRANGRASLSIDSLSTLVSKGMFTTISGLSAQGAESDYKLSRNTAQLKLLKPLQAGDSLSAGTEATKASIISADIPGGSVTLASDGYIWFLVDVPQAIFIQNSVSADTLLNVLKPSANIVRFESFVANAFNAVQVGDWVVISSLELSPANRLEGRVHARTSTTLDIKVTASEFAAAVAEGPIIFQEGFTTIRTPKAVQKLKIAAGNYSLFQLAALIQSSILGVTASVINDKNLVITTKTEEVNGSVLVVEVDQQAKVLNLTKGLFSQSDASLFAYYESTNSESSFPAFVHSKIIADAPADPPSSFLNLILSSEDLDALGVEDNNIICGTEPFNLPADNAINNECVQIDTINGTLIDIAQNPLLRRVRPEDRFFVTYPYDFSDNDSLITILDNDAANKTFPIPLFRRATANNTSAISPISFRAFDSDSGPTAQFSQFFPNFDFKNYKVMMKARNVIHPTLNLVNEDAILIRSVQLGLSGEKIKVSIEYPTQPDSDILNVALIEDFTRISLFLKSGNPINNTIDGTTEWDITITPNAGRDEVTYSWNGNGSNPTIGAELSSGGYVTIDANGEFDPRNTGSFRVISATATSFTVTRPTGAALAESNRATLTNNTVSVFEADDTTAAELVDYINAELSELIEASLINDNGVTGAGVISISTFEDSDFTEQFISLVDGQNHILSSNLAAASPNPQFTFKKPLLLPSFSTATANAYAFNNGEVIKLIPTTAKQVEDLINVLAVSGVSTVGNVRAVARNSKIQIKSDILGSNGSVQVVGGRANLSSAEVQQAASRIGNYTRVVVERSAIAGMHGGQWVKLQAANLQRKNTNVNELSIISTTPNAPVAGKTLVRLDNRQIENLFFGKPRNVFKDLGAGLRVEKQGSLVAIMWNEDGPQPSLSKSVEVNNTTEVLEVFYNPDSGLTEYSSAGSRNFMEASAGDKLIVSGFTNPENNGTFNIVGISEDGLTISVDNFDGVNEATTSIAQANLEVTASIREGDSVIIGDAFSVLNRGLFRVVRTFNSTFWIENPLAVEEDVTVAANPVALTFDATTEFDISSEDNGVKLQWNGNGTNPSLSLVKVGDLITLGTDFDAANQGSFVVTGKASNYVLFENALFTPESAVQITDVLSVHKPSVKFFDYEATIENDAFIVGGDILGESGIGSYRIDEIRSQNEIVVDGIISTSSNLSLGAKFTEIIVEEQTPYVGYKRIFNKSFDTSNTNQGVLVFDSANQFLKINKDAGAVGVASLSKLEFPTTIRKGIDAYRFHTGLLRQANKVVYGEPRGSEFEGVAAAGAEIFIQPPLVRRIQLSIVVRLNTGIPFVRVIEEVRNNVSSLINSTEIGQSIAISDIVSAVNSISGVFAVSIASPSYSPSSDVIVVNPSEKPLILDAVADIIVSKVGI